MYRQKIFRKTFLTKTQNLQRQDEWEDQVLKKCVSRAVLPDVHSERIFSIINLNKTKHHSCLTNKTLSGLLYGKSLVKNNVMILTDVLKLLYNLVIESFL